MITLIKEFTYRGNPEEFSNSYHLDSVPASRGDWVDLVGALGSQERTCVSGAVTYKRGLVYDNSDHPALYTIVYADEGGEFTGDLIGTEGDVTAGDQAAVVSVNTGLVGSSGKPIWLRKYFHSVYELSGTDVDSLASTTIAALSSFMTNLRDSEIQSGHFYADKNGRRPDGTVRVDEFVTTRTLKRRGKRPH